MSPVPERRPETDTWLAALRDVVCDEPKRHPFLALIGISILLRLFTPRPMQILFGLLIAVVVWSIVALVIVGMLLPKRWLER